VCEPIFNKPLKEISFAQVLLRLFETARRFDMQVQPQLILLQKTLFNIEGLGRQLYPELDLWKTARPVLAAWMRDRISPRTIVGELRRHWPDALLTLRQVPHLLQNAVRDAGKPRPEAPSLNALREEMQRASRRRGGLLAALTLWLCGVLWIALRAPVPWLGWLQLGAAVVLLSGTGSAAQRK
jgi:ubiquinone biosynthesis protein